MAKLHYRTHPLTGKQAPAAKVPGGFKYGAAVGVPEHFEEDGEAVPPRELAVPTEAPAAVMPVDIDAALAGLDAIADELRALRKRLAATLGK
jgi:hypothetical protein